MAKAKAERTEGTKKTEGKVKTEGTAKNKKSIKTEGVNEMVETENKETMVNADEEVKTDITEETAEQTEGQEITDEADDNVIPAPPEFEDVPAEDPTPIVNAILARTDISNGIKWAMIKRAADENFDEGLIKDVSVLSVGEIQRRLRLLASKKVMANKAGNVNELIEIEMDSERLKAAMPSVQRQRTSPAVVATADPSKLSQEDLAKLIRNVQSKKCSAKKAGDEARLAELLEEEAKLVALRQNAPSGAAKVNAMSTKIKETIAELEKLPQSPEIEAQLVLLRTLV